MPVVEPDIGVVAIISVWLVFGAVAIIAVCSVFVTDPSYLVVFEPMLNLALHRIRLIFDLATTTDNGQ